MRAVTLFAAFLLVGCQAAGGPEPEAARSPTGQDALVQGHTASAEWSLHLVESVVHSGIVTSLAVSDGSLGAVGVERRAWFLEGGEWSLVDLPASATRVASASAGRLVFGTTEGHVCIVKAERLECIGLPRDESVTNVRVQNDTILVASSGGYDLVDAGGPSVIASVQTDFSFGSMTLTDTPGVVRAVSDSGFTIEWFTRDGRVERVEGPALWAMSAVRWGVRGRRFVVGEGRGAVLSAYTYGREVPDAEWDGWAGLPDASAGLDVVAARSEADGVLVYDGDLRVRVSLPPRPLEGEGPLVTALDLSEDGRRLAVAYRDGVVDLYEVRRETE